MRKTIINPSQQAASSAHGWLDLEHLAQVELTSENEDHPIESAIKHNNGTGTGWKATQPGEQTIRLLFDEPQNIRRIHVLFLEREQERTQEFQLRMLLAGEESYREIVRQQYNFSPPHTTEESEEYEVDNVLVKAVELNIIPDTSGKTTYASLAQLRLR